MARGSLAVVRENLQNYADRGVFRGFSEVRNGQFRFIWGIHREMELILDTERQSLRFKRLLPGLPASSDLYRELKRFVAERQDPKLPPHRRIDRRRAEVSCSNRGGGVSISLKVKNNQYAYGVNRIVNLVHELFVHLKDVHPGYLAENFDVPEE
ncbi:MAG: hypothetical protein ABI882_11565 [Acidobacteriota bacterium]